MERLSRKEQKDKTRTGLIERAEALFSKKGIAATTTADVAKALKVSHGTVFIHFATRDQLVLEVVDRFGERLAEALQKSLTDEMPLKDLLKAHLSVLAEFEDFYLRLIAESFSLPPAIRSVVTSMNSSLSYRIDRAAKPLMESGELKRLKQPELFNTWMALIHYHLMNRDLFSEKTPVLEHLGDRIVQHYLSLIKTGGKS